jgi:cell division septation protein DedD
MFTPQRFSVVLIVLGALTAAPSAMARVDCRPSDKACIVLHRPSTAAERAQTRTLNRQSRDVAVPQPVADNDAYAGSDVYAREQEQYRRDMQAYRQEQRRYEQALRRGSYRGRPGLSYADRDACRAIATAPRPQPGMSWSDQAWAEDHEAFAPTGGKVDPSMAAPAPGLSGSTTGLTAFNARSSGLQRQCDPPRRPFNRYR